MSDLMISTFYASIEQIESNLDIFAVALPDIRGEADKHLPFHGFPEFERNGFSHRWEFTLAEARIFLSVARDELANAHTHAGAGDFEKAWSSLVVATDIAGRLQGCDNYCILKNEVDEFVLYMQMKALALVAEKQPAGGWKSYAEIFREINADLCEYAQEIKPREKPYLDMVGRLEDWKSSFLVFGAALDALIASSQLKKENT